MKTLNASDCIDYIEKNFHVQLFDYQKQIIEDWFAGKSVATGRSCGRSFLAGGVQAYLKNWATDLDKRNIPDQPERFYSTINAVRAGLFDRKLFYDILKDGELSQSVRRNFLLDLDE